MRLVVEHYATWADLKSMTIDDVDMQNIAIDEWEAAGRRARKD